MRRAPAFAALLLLPACGGGSSASQAPRQANMADTSSRPAQPPPTPTPSPPVSRQIGAAGNMSAHTSSLRGTISDFAVERTDFGTRVQLAADTLFEFDKAELTPAAQTNLQRTAELVRQGGRGTVTIIGHTDSRGEEAYNLDLSKRRAEAVAAWLRVQPGMDARTFAVEGHGEAEPIAPNSAADGTDDPQGRARNRRVTVDIPK